MNTVEGYKGFITFLILSGIILTGVIGFNYIAGPTSLTSEATDTSLVPINIQTVNLSSNSTQITWTTQSPAEGVVIFSRNRDSECLTSFNIRELPCRYIDEPNRTTNHSLTLSNLTPGVTYYFRISNDGFEDSEINAFTTSEELSEVVPEDEGDTEEPSQPDRLIPLLPVDTEPEDDPDSRGIVPDVLGVQTFANPTKPVADINKLIANEFKEAILYQDLRYDFNRDGQVTMEDYPLFINFIVGKDVRIPGSADLSDQLSDD